MISPVKIWRNQQRITDLSGMRGKIVSWTIVRVPPGGFSAQAPYPVVLVELEDASRVMCQLVDYDEADVAIGAPVVCIVRKILEPLGDGVIPYGIKVKSARRK